jgi:hypothetical protein
MALTSLDKDNTNRLFAMLSLNNNDNNINIIKSNYSSYGQLKQIANQIAILQHEAQNIISGAKLNDHLHKIEMGCKKVCGTYYYHYKMDDKEILSMISPDEWNTYFEFLGKYLYNYDNLFYLQE